MELGCQISRFTEIAKQIQEQVLALKAAELAAHNAREALAQLNGEAASIPANKPQTPQLTPNSPPSLGQDEEKRIRNHIEDLEF